MRQRNTPPGNGEESRRISAVVDEAAVRASCGTEAGVPSRRAGPCGASGPG